MNDTQNKLVMYFLTGSIYRWCEKRDHLLQEDRCTDPGDRREHEWICLSTLLCEWAFMLLFICSTEIYNLSDTVLLLICPQLFTHQTICLFSTLLVLSPFFGSPFRITWFYFNHYLFLFFKECSNVFSKGGGEELAKMTGSVFLGESHSSELLVMLACSHKVSRYTSRKCHSWPTSHDSGSFPSLPCCLKFMQTLCSKEWCITDQ